MHRPLYDIAETISKDLILLGKQLPHAQPYLEAMSELDLITDNYYQDTANEIVARFLCNAQTWRGDTARSVKKELNLMLNSNK